jgi:hypothetical protein
VHVALAIEEIKSSYNLMDWTGDRCVPIPHAWVTCNFGSNSNPSITEVYMINSLVQLYSHFIDFIKDLK